MTADRAPAEHPGDLEDEAHGAGDHAVGHEHEDHGHDSESLGPVDTLAWGAFGLGIALGLAVALAVSLSVGGLPA